MTERRQCGLLLHALHRAESLGRQGFCVITLLKVLVDI
jgi:hypothetical protein